MKSSLLLLLSGTLLLTACALGPDFKAPDAPATKTYTPEKEILAPEQRIALGQHIEADWWTLLASPSIDDMIRHALTDNNDLAAAREILAQADATAQAQAGQLMPQVSLDALAGRQKYGVALFGPSNFFIPPFTYYEAGPTLSWTPDIFGGRKRRVEYQQALAEYQHHELDALYVTLTGNVVVQAVQLATMQAEIESVKQILEADETLLTLARAAFEAGAATRQDILEAQARVTSDRGLLAPLEKHANLNAHMLGVLAGKAPADWQPPSLHFGELRFPSTLPVTLPSELVHQRPDILAAEANLHAASAAIGIATANLYPDLTLSANLFQEALTPSSIFYGVSNAWSIAGSISAPLLDGGSRAAEKEAAEHAYQAALAVYRQTVVQAFSQVADALATLSHDTESLVIAQAALEIAQSELDLDRQQLEAGSTARLNLETAKRASAQARLHVLEAQGQQFQDAAALFVALGGTPTPGPTKKALNEKYPDR